METWLDNSWTQQNVTGKMLAEQKGLGNWEAAWGPHTRMKKGDCRAVLQRELSV